MPCDHETGCPIAGAQKAFRARIAEEVLRAEAFLAQNRASDDEKAAHASVTLGAFAGGHVDAARFSALLGGTRRADPTTLARVEEAAKTLRDLSERIDAYTKIATPPHGSLHDTVAAALAEVGRVFGAARVVELARSDRYVDADHGRLMRGLRPAEWSAAERAVVPWMRVIVRGTQLHAAGLAEFLDGGLKIILKVDGVVPPAPLARLVSPGIYVAQVAGKADLAAFRSFDGPAVALIGGEGAALFTHDPRSGARSSERLTIADLPAPRRRAVGAISVFQMNEDLALLAALAEAPAAPAEVVAVAAVDGNGAEPAAVDPTDRLASWLLGQAGIPGQIPGQA